MEESSTFHGRFGWSVDLFPFLYAETFFFMWAQAGEWGCPQPAQILRQLKERPKIINKSVIQITLTLLSDKLQPPCFWAVSWPLVLEPFSWVSVNCSVSQFKPRASLQWVAVMSNNTAVCYSLIIYFLPALSFCIAQRCPTCPPHPKGQFLFPLQCWGAPAGFGSHLNVSRFQKTKAQVVMRL